MDSKIIFEVIGYVGSALVLVSFLMSSVLKLRIINTLGSVVSAIYGMIMHTYPTVVMNVALMIINIVYIIKLYRNTDAKIYHMHEVASTDEFLGYFIENHREDINNFFSGFVFPPEVYNFAQEIYYKDTVIGVILGYLDENGVLDIYLDYTAPEHRDFSAGKHAYDKFGDMGIKKINFLADPLKSIAYLEKMGFVNEDGKLVKTY